tara:strand:+ start:15714 stop:16406 length:693 start_codon:yes stop_codon:yes gene_type:complete
MKNTNTFLILAGLALGGYLLYTLNKDEDTSDDDDNQQNNANSNDLAEAEYTEIDDTGEIETTSGGLEEAETDLNTGVTTLDPNNTNEDSTSGEIIYGDVLVTPYDKVQVRVRNLGDGLYEFKAIVNEDMQYVDQSGYNPDFQYPPIADWEFTTFNVNNGEGEIELLPDEVVLVQYTQNAVIPITAQWDFDNSVYDPTVNFDLEVLYLGNQAGAPNQGGGQQDQTANLGDQ